MPKTLAVPVHSRELVIKKSRFIGCVQLMTDRTEALKVVAALHARHPSANHVCWALLAGGQSAAVDDGEPGGTAGRPMLEVLRHQDLESVLATVVRYRYVKLGAGGLVRAYTDSIAQALLSAQKIDIVKIRHLDRDAPYPLEGLVRRTIASGAALIDTHGESNTGRFRFSLLENCAYTLIRGLNESGSGKIRWKDTGRRVIKTSDR